MKYTDTIMRCLSPLYDNLPKQRVDHLAAGSVPSKVSVGVQSAPLEVRAEASCISLGTLETCDIDAWIGSAVEMAETALASLMPQLFKAIDASAEVHVDAAGQQISHDLLLDMLEQMELDIDEHGKLTNLAIVCSPSLAEAISQLPPMSGEQKQRMESIIKKKQKENNARKRVRKLD